MNKEVIYRYEANFKDNVEACINYERRQQGKSLLTFEYSKYLKVPSEFGMGLRVIVKNGESHIATYNAAVSDQGEVFFSSFDFGLNDYYNIVGQLQDI